MNRNSIIALPNPHLRERSQRVRAITPEVQQLIAGMEAATLDWEDHRPHELGVALAAVQVDTLQRVIIIRNDFDDKEDRTFFTLINPEITKVEGKPTLDHEGCLSVPDIYGLVPRHPKIRLKALDGQGKQIRLKVEGFLARVLQHEVDHVNGIVFIDHIKNEDAFFKLNKAGELEKVPYEIIRDSRILW
jgi:peptide deformylase